MPRVQTVVMLPVFPVLRPPGTGGACDGGTGGTDGRDRAFTTPQSKFRACSRRANQQNSPSIFFPLSPIAANSVTMSGDKQLEQACLDGVVLIKELEAASAKINPPLLARCDAILFQW